ncbi:unnamed protein product [Thelazia callipaeda]|uniref:ANK_REP_REGION domain-containing protein n=1 Tax=Thelazia callipaeda TaxID=103827 RepID=A0A0N5CLI8_THECL|nr:unnamed protein product [Thelazia callipaeda]
MITTAGTSAPSKLRIMNSKRTNRMRVMTANLAKLPHNYIITTDELEPFLPLLPDVADIDMKEQKQLFQQLYSAGIAASWLTMSTSHHFPRFPTKLAATTCIGEVKEGFCFDNTQNEKIFNVATAFQNVHLSQSHQISFTPEDAELSFSYDASCRKSLHSCSMKLGRFFIQSNFQALKTLSRSGILDDAVESLRQFPLLDENLFGAKDDPSSPSIITPDIAAAALSAFAAATLRRPPTRAIESLMASSQEPVTANGGPDSTDEESLELNLSEDESEDNGDMLLNLAVSAGVACLHLTKELVEIRGNPNYASINNDRTPLMEACCAGKTLFYSVYCVKYEFFKLQSSFYVISEIIFLSSHVEIVQHLLEHGANVNAISATKNTPLIYASAAGNVKIIKKLLLGFKTLFLRVIDMEFEKLSNRYCFWCLSFTVTFLLQCAKLLLDYGCDTTIRNDNGHCALMEAASSGYLDVVSLLVEHGVQVLPCSEDELKVGLESSLTLAAYKGHYDVVHYLLEKGSKKYQEELHTALMEASMDGHYEVARLLLDSNAPVNLASDSFESPLTLAACGGHRDLVYILLFFIIIAVQTLEVIRQFVAYKIINVQLLLERGAIVEEVNDEGYTPLMEASREGHLVCFNLYVHNNAPFNRRTFMIFHVQEVVKLLIKFGAKVNTVTDETGETALTLAACGGFKDVVELLIRNDARLDIGVNTPLMEAAQEGHLETLVYRQVFLRLKKFLRFHYKLCGVYVKLLFKVDATTTANSNTALTYGAENGHLDVCAALIEFGANIDHRAEKGRTALMKAAKNGNYSVIQFLLMRGAKRKKQELESFLFQVNEVSTDNDASALSLACSHGHWEIVRLLLDHGADPSHVFKVETLLNWHDVPVVTRTPLLSKPPALQNNRLKKVARRTVSKKATTSIHPKIECAERSTSMLVDVDEKMGNSERTRAVTEVHSSCTHDSQLVSGTHSMSTNTSVPSHLLAHYNYQQNAINPDELRGMIAGMAAMAAQSNVLPNDHLFAQIAEKALRGTFTSSEVTSSLSDKKMHQQFSELLKQQFSILANRQKDALAGLGGPSPLPDSENDGSTSYSPSVASSPSPPMVACCETTAAHVTQVSNPHTNTRKGSISNERQKSVVGRGMLLKKGFGEQRGCFPPTSIRFPAPPPPLMNTNIPRVGYNWLSVDLEKCSFLAVRRESSQYYEKIKRWASSLKVSVGLVRSVPLSPRKLQHSPSAKQQQHVIPVTGQHRPKLALETAGDQLLAEKSASRSRARRTLSESAMHVGDGQRAAEKKACDADSDSGETVNKSGAKSTVAHAFNVDMQTDSNHDTALTLAATGGHDSLVELLVTRGADIEHKDKKGFTPLILAATAGHSNVVELLLNHGANIEAQSDRTKDTALSLACSGGRKELLCYQAINYRFQVVEILLKRGANKEHRNVSDYTPLSLAASGGYVDIVNSLLNSGAEINSRTGSKLGISPLMLAAMNGHAPATKILLERGSDINSHIETNRNTALTLACFQGRTDVVRLLLEYNANVEHRAKTGLTPLMEAANGGYVEVGELLLSAGADPNTAPVPTSRDTALTIAADKGHHKFVEMLIHARAQIDVKNKKGCTALWLACHGGHLETVQTLVKHEADVDSQDNRSVSPLIIAFRRGHMKVVKYMVRHVQQFPSDSDCYRFISTINDKELLGKCHLCMDIIVAAKDRQAAEANRAAESLLEILAKEEAQAKSKKLSKQRQNEKKKAKRKAKKNQADSNTEKKDVDRKDDEPPSNNGEESADEEHLSEKANFIASVDESFTGDRDVENEIDPPRVPVIVSEEQSADETIFVHPESLPSKFECGTLMSTDFSSNTKSSRQRIRKETGKSGVSGRLLPQKSGSGNTSDTEWMKATSKKNVGKTVTSARSPACGTTRKEETGNNAGAWRYVDSGRRRSARLSVSSSSIARVIGRAGGNINAIREATGAYIEVEKQTGKKEQHDRQITLKGSDAALRHSGLIGREHDERFNIGISRTKQAVEMIHGLIDDSECNVEDVIQRVNSIHNSTTSQSEENAIRSTSALSGTGIVPSTTSPLTAQKKPVSGITVSQESPEMVHKVVTTSKKTIPHMTTTNVWAQRAAQRQSQKIVSAIGSEKKQKMSAFTELEKSNCDISMQPVTPGIVRTIQNVPVVNTSIFQAVNETQERIVKEFCRAPGHARPTSACASTSSASPIGTIVFFETRDINRFGRCFHIFSKIWTRLTLQSTKYLEEFFNVYQFSFR